MDGRIKNERLILVCIFLCSCTSTFTTDELKIVRIELDGMSGRNTFKYTYTLKDKYDNIVLYNSNKQFNYGDSIYLEVGNKE